VAATTQLADAEVALALADATLHNRLNKVLEGALGELGALRCHGNKARLAPKPHKRRLALKVRRYAVHPLWDGLVGEGGDVDKHHGRHDADDNDDAGEWRA
jgi:hypothetical protein